MGHSLDTDISYTFMNLKYLNKKEDNVLLKSSQLQKLKHEMFYDQIS